MLTQSFNSMTLQLADARAQAERNQAQLAHANAYLESILANLSAGVLAFDGNLRLRSATPSAGQILETDFTALLGRALDEWGAHDGTLEGLARSIRDGLESAETVEWEQQVEREVKGGTQVLLLRGTRLPQSAETGSVIVFDDITHLLQAQRDAAWAEVARRLAHEIKNPLTPIQLSAERLQHKLAAKLTEPDAEMLTRSTQTIVNQVDGPEAHGRCFQPVCPHPGTLDAGTRPQQAGARGADALRIAGVEHQARACAAAAAGDRRCRSVAAGDP